MTKEEVKFQVALSCIQGVLEAKHGILGEVVPSLAVAESLRIADEFVKQWFKEDRSQSKVDSMEYERGFLAGQGSTKQRKEWSEEDEQFLLVCKNALQKYQSSDSWDANIISKWLEEKLKASSPLPKQGWSEEEQQTISFAVDWLTKMLERTDVPEAKQDIESVILGLKFLRPQPKQEWSKEEERHLYNAIEAVKYVYDISEGTNGFKCVEFLKSFHPQLHWKPGKEQINALKVVARGYPSDDLDAIESLLNDLQKLL